MKLSKRCEYGIKAAVQLAKRYGNGYTQSREIAAVESLPAKFLESILLALRSASILESKVGAGGGYRLARAPASIGVTELLMALHRHEEPKQEIGAAERCEVPSGQCAIDLMNERLDRAFLAVLGSLTLEDLSTLPAPSSSNGAPPARTLERNAIGAAEALSV